MVTGWGAKRDVRWLVAGLAVIAIASAAWSAVAGADRSDPDSAGVRRDPADTPGPLDLGAARAAQQAREFSVTVYSHRALPPLGSLRPFPTALDSAPAHICLMLDGAGVERRLLCPGGRPEANKIRVGVSTYSARTQNTRLGEVEAELDRRGTNGIRLTFELRDLGLTPGRFHWRIVASWPGPPCGRGATPACFDRLPDGAAARGRIFPVIVSGCERVGPPVHFNGGRGRPRVALTFDDGPSPYTAPILEVLENHHAHATFFEVGAETDGQGPLMQRILDAGNEIGNHSLHHKVQPDHASMVETSNLIEAQTGFRPCLFRPPYGKNHPDEVSDAWRAGMSTVIWDVDTNDWRGLSSASITASATAGGHGSIVLMHDGGGDRSQTLAALPAIIRSYRSRGYRLVTVTQLLGGETYWQEVHGGRGR